MIGWWWIQWDGLVTVLTVSCYDLGRRIPLVTHFLNPTLISAWHWLRPRKHEEEREKKEEYEELARSRRRRRGRRKQQGGKGGEGGSSKEEKEGKEEAARRRRKRRRRRGKFEGQTEDTVSCSHHHSLHSMLHTVLQCCSAVQCTAL